MTTDELIQALTLRGLMLAWANGGPVLQGPKHMKTPAVLKVLKHHREEIIERVKPKAEPEPPPLMVYEPPAEPEPVVPPVRVDPEPLPSAGPPPLECPRIIRWRTDGGMVFTTIPGTSPLKPVAWPYVPVEATAFAWDGGYDYRPLSELPPCWGLKRLDTEAG